MSDEENTTLDNLSRPMPKALSGLSAKLLILTVFFVMLAELLIYTPSISRYRKAYLEEHIAAAHLASLALEATCGNQLRAAEMLGLNRNTLRKKIRELDIDVVRGVK